MVRVRPPLPRELAFDTAVEVLSDKEIVIYRPEQEFASVYDVVLKETSTQDETYKHVKGETKWPRIGYYPLPCSWKDGLCASLRSMHVTAAW